MLKEKVKKMIMSRWGGYNVPAHFLGSSLVEFYLINSPYCTLDILNSHETFVKTKIMSNCVLSEVRIAGGKLRVEGKKKRAKFNRREIKHRIEEEFPCADRPSSQFTKNRETFRELSDYGLI